MATVTTNYGTSPVSLAVTALHSLATNSFWKSAAINFGTNDPVWVQLQVKLVTASTGSGIVTGYSNVYLACSNDNSQYDANISPGDAAWSSTNPTTAAYAKSLRFIGRLPMETGQTASYTWAGTFNIELPPKYAVVVIENQTNKSLNSSGNAVTYLENTLTIA